MRRFLESNPKRVHLPGIEQIPLRHRVVLGEHRNKDRWVFGPLRLMDRHRVGRHQRVEFAEAVGHTAAVERRGEFAHVGVDLVDVADVAVVDLLGVVGLGTPEDATPGHSLMVNTQVNTNVSAMSDVELATYEKLLRELREVLPDAPKAIEGSVA